MVGDSAAYVGLEISEPLLISPLVLDAPENEAGFYGLTHVNFQMSMGAHANRAWRSIKFAANDDPPEYFSNPHSYIRSQTRRCPSCS